MNKKEAAELLTEAYCLPTSPHFRVGLIVNGKAVELPSFIARRLKRVFIDILFEYNNETPQTNETN